MSLYEEIEVGKIRLADDKLREVGDIEELTQSIISVGLLHPLTVVRDGEEFVVVVGSRRLVAAQAAGLGKVHARVIAKWTEEERLQAMIIENLLREDLTPLEEAEAYKRLRDLGLKQQEIAELVHVSQETVSRRLALLNLPEEVKLEIDAGTIDLRTARELNKLKGDPESQREIAAAIVKSAETKADIPTPVASRVDDALDRRKHEKALAKARKELEEEFKDKAIIIETTDKFMYDYVLPEGVKEVTASKPYSQDSGRWVNVDDMEEHAKLPCAGWGIFPRDLKRMQLCLDPDSHPDYHAEREAQEDREKAAFEKRQADWKRATLKRRAFVKDLVANPTRELMVSFSLLAMDSLVRSYMTNGPKVADMGELLDLTGTQEEIDQAIKAIATEGKLIERERVALAFAALALEASIDVFHISGHGIKWLRLLEKAHGFKLSKVERVGLERAEKQQAAINSPEEDPEFAPDLLEELADQLGLAPDERDAWMAEYAELAPEEREAWLAEVESTNVPAASRGDDEYDASSTAGEEVAEEAA